MLFNQLKRELLNPENTLEDNFALLVELKNSTLKNFAIKKLFWKVIITWFEFLILFSFVWYSIGITLPCVCLSVQESHFSGSYTLPSEAVTLQAICVPRTLWSFVWYIIGITLLDNVCMIVDLSICLVLQHFTLKVTQDDVHFPQMLWGIWRGQSTISGYPCCKKLAN